MAASRYVVLGLLAVGLAVLSVEAKKKVHRPFPTGEKKSTPEQRKYHPKFTKSDQHHRATLPDTFDARRQWPKCKSISDIRNQAQCGTCWAVSSASVLSDRLCIASGQVTQDFISASNIAGCSFPDQTPEQNCKDGGWTTTGYERATFYGVPTGGNYKDPSRYNQTDGCQPYNVAPGDEVEQTCEAGCWNTKYSKRATRDDLKYVDAYFAIPNPGTDQSKIKDAVNAMKADLVANGPMTVSITCYSDFQGWEKSDGPYCLPDASAYSMGGHAVRVIGWDKTPNNKYYWLIANSWGTDMGDNGIYWIEMGKNCAGVESQASAPIVKMPNNCGKFGASPVDQVIRIPADNPSSPIFAFQGNCTVEVSIGSDGRMTPKGTLVPIAQQFVGGVSGPINRWMKGDSSSTWIVNTKSDGAGCTAVDGSKKFKCYTGPLEIDAAPWTLSRNGYGYYYYLAPEKAKMIYGWPDDSSITTNQYNDIGTLFTDSFSKVASLLDIDGTKMQVCGTDRSGRGLCGILSYRNWKQWQSKPGPQA